MYFFVSQPIFFKLGHIIDMTWAGVVGGLKFSRRHDVVTSRKFVLATVGAFFDRFASDLVETCLWHRRIVSCEKKRHDVTTSLRKNVDFGGFSATVTTFFDRFASNLVETCTRYIHIKPFEKIVVT